MSLMTMIVMAVKFSGSKNLSLNDTVNHIVAFV